MESGDKTIVAVTGIILICGIFLACYLLHEYSNVQKDAFKNGYVQVQGYGTTSNRWVKP